MLKKLKEYKLFETGPGAGKHAQCNDFDQRRMGPGGRAVHRRIL